MNIKRSIIFGLYTLLSIISDPSQATCCRPLCSFRPPSNIQGYIDVGLGKTLSSHLSASNNIWTESSRNADEWMVLFLTPQKMAVENNLLLESGILWAQPLKKTGSYFPYVNLGLRYQYSNLNNDQTLLRLVVVKYENNDLDSQLFSDGYYAISQQSLLASLKLDLYRWQRIMPYLSVALGTTWHQGKQKTPLYFNPQEIRNIYELQTDLKKNRAFSYSLGAGFDFPINDHFWLSLGYQYNHLGDIKLKPRLIGLNKEAQEEIQEKIKETGLNNFLKSINLKNLNTQTIQLTGRYLFG